MLGWTGWQGKRHSGSLLAQPEITLDRPQPRKLSDVKVVGTVVANYSGLGALMLKDMPLRCMFRPA